MQPDREPFSFATTRWTLICEAARDGEPGAAKALSVLLETYWRPLYHYVRRMGRTAQDAEDLVQGFFLHLLRLKGLQLADRDRGRFRSFLLGCLKNFLANEWQREHRLKRGGYVAHLSINWKDAETELGLELEDGRSPDKLFDRDWALALLDKVLGGLAREEKDFERWKPFLGLRSDHLPYTQIASECGISEGAARVAAHRLRKRFRQRLREEIALTLADERQADEEMRALFAALSS